MKKVLLALALATASFTASAATVVAETSYHAYKTTPDRSTYWALGVAVPALAGSLDVYAQGIRATGAGYVDNLNGFEVGYGQFVEAGRVTLNPRIAFGTMGNINNGVENVTGKYTFLSLEATTRLSQKVGAFASLSHMHRLNGHGLVQNAARFGVDVGVGEGAGVRVGASVIRGNQQTQRGVVLLTFVSF